MVRIMLIFTFIFLLSAKSATQEAARKAGMEIGKKRATSAFKQGKNLNPKDLLSEDAKDQVFDAQEAEKAVKNEAHPQSETLNFLMSKEVQNNQRRKGFHEDEQFFALAEQIFSGTENESSQESEENYTLHTCKQSAEPIIISTERRLNVKQEIKIKKCQGHIKKFKKSKIKNIIEIKEQLKKLISKYKADPNIKPKSVKKIELEFSDDYWPIGVYYEHIDQTEGCDNCKYVKDESYQESGEDWIYDDQRLWDLAKSLDSTILEHVCIDSSPVNHQCQKERMSFLYQFPTMNDCDFLKEKNCEMIKQECLQYQSSVCSQWEMTFRCLDHFAFKSVAKLDIDSSEESIKIKYKPNQSFSEVATKLAVFDAAKKEMEKSGSFDVRDLQIFTGMRKTCSKNVADKLIYDCCFNYSGLAKQIGLSKCNSDEIALADMREQGLCHYVGSYEETFANLWKSRDEHVFCCFPNKLSRIVQEQGRQQLGIKWGSPKEPDCRGFTTDELGNLNFSKMDLSEFSKDIKHKLPEDMPERLKNFQDRLQQEIVQTEVKK